MEKKQKNSCPLGACEKICKAIGISPAFRTMRRVSQNPQHPRPPNGDAAESVPIKFDNSGLPPPPNEKHKSASATPHPQAQRKEPKSQGVAVEKVKSIPSAVTDMAQPRETLVPTYGQVVKVPSKIEPELPVISSQQKVIINGGQSHGQGSKTGAKVDREEGKKWEANGEDKFSEYINRAKMKIRTMSHAGDHGKNVSGGEDHSKDRFSDYINRAKHKIRSMSTFK